MIALIGGMVLDLLLGDPGRWPHPIRWIGRAAGWGHGFIQARISSPRVLEGAGLLLGVGLSGGVWAAAAILLSWLNKCWPWSAQGVGVLMVWSCLSLKDLIHHVRRVFEALRTDDLDSARQMLALVVGRETSRLDETGVARAGLETLAESLCDGVIAPLFFLILGGPPLGLAYKTVNTLDSMIGHPFAPYTHVGRWPARLDDAANWLPARISFLFIAAGAALRRLNAGRAFRIALAEHNHSLSPNAGWPEAALAGALGVSLLGPAVYDGRSINKSFINPEGRAPSTDDLEAGLRLIWVSGLLAYVVSGLIILR